ncbi:MAG: T9SS type A sorting domain-containing protein [Melioribacteraceae bacterium]
MKKSNTFLFVMLISLLSLVSVKAQYIGFSPSNGQTYNLSSGASSAVVTIYWTWQTTAIPYVYNAYAKLTVDGSTSYRTGIKNNDFDEIPQSIAADPGTHTLKMELFENFGDGYGITFTSTHTIYVKNGIIAQNNFSGGVINLEGNQVNVNGTANKVYKLPNESVSVGAINQQDGDYWMLWNTSGTYNSNWKRNGEPLNGETSSSLSYTVGSSDNGVTLSSDMKKQCNLTFSAPGNSIVVNGSYYTNSASVSVVEQNTVTATVTTSNYTSDGIEYTFNGWKSDGILYGTTITPTTHKEFTADYTGRPVYVSFNFDCDLNDLIKLVWTDNQNPAVTQYHIYRMGRDNNGVYTTPVHIGTVNRGVGYFEDQDYTRTNVKNYSTWLEYTVRAYYTTEGTLSDDGWMTIWGNLLPSMQNNNLALAKAESEVPTEYSIGNYPNPFNPTTTINYQLPKDGMVTIKVYDIIGKEVATLVNEAKSAGYYKVDFDASKLTSGVYICSIQASAFSKSIKLMLTK